MSESSPDADPTMLLADAVQAGRMAQYRLVRKVGAGATGAVFLAQDTDLDRKVAIKLLHPALPGGEEPTPLLEERFLREARSAAQLNHPNVALVYQIGRQGASTFLVMEWLEGTDLAQHVRQHGAMAWKEAVAAARDAAAGLAAAHAAGLVHRDVKPSNLMRLASGQVKLVDFGLARLHDAASELTASGSILGTPAYLSPEQCCGDPATPQSDVYALSCTLFHLLTGHAPFQGSHIAAVMHQQLNTPLPDVCTLVPGLPAALGLIVARGAAKRPRDRFASAAEMQAALEAVLHDRPLVAAADASTLAADPSPPPALEPVGNLPLSTGTFIGRELQTAQLIDLLRQSRLVTLTGPGGTGKTRLSQHVARRVAPMYPHGVWMIELAALPADADVALATATVLGLRETTGQSVEAALVQHLRGRQALLLLDNCEHVIDAAAALAARLCAVCEQLHVLATSRQALGCPGELTLAVPPLGVGAEGATLQELVQVESVRLFVDRARAARPGFELSDASAGVVAQICRRLDGIPLAIELAAARVKVLAPLQIASRLDDAFKLLTGGQRTLLPRQQTLRALIDWSWDLLDEPQRRALARCSVFAGEFSLEAAEAVLVGPEEGELAFDVLDALAGLVDKSLLVAVEREGVLRYALLQTIRQYAAARLGAEEALAARHRHARHYADRVVQARERFDSADHAGAMRQIASEHEQARAALDAAAEHGWFDIALPLGDALANYWNLAGVLVDGVARVSRLLAMKPPAGAETAALLRRAADLAVRCGRHDLARDWLDQGLAMARASGAGNTAGRLLNGLGSLAYSQGQFEAAAQHFADYLACCRDGGDRDGQIRAVNNLAIVLRRLGRPEAARRHFHDALALLQQAPNPRLIAYLNVNLGDLECEDGHPGTARGLYEACLQVMEPLAEDWGIALARAGLGKCALALGDAAQARELLSAALGLLRKMGERESIAEALDQLARVAIELGSMDEARTWAAEGLSLRLDAGSLPDVAGSLDTWAALIEAAQPEQAARLQGAAAALRTAQRAPLEAARAAQQDALAQALAERLGEAAFDRALAEGSQADAVQVARALVTSASD